MKKLLPLLVLFLLARNASAALSAQTTVWNETCGNANGAIQVDASGGQWPMTIAWSTGPTGWTITDLTPGWYIFTITDADSQVLVDSAEVLAVPYLEWPGNPMVPQAGLFGCGGCNAGLHLSEDPADLLWYNVEGFGSFSPDPFATMPGSGWLFGPYCANDCPQITITDNTGCTGTVTIAPLNVSQGGPMALVDVEGACLGANGNLTVEVNGIDLKRTKLLPALTPNGFPYGWVELIERLHLVGASELHGRQVIIFVLSGLMCVGGESFFLGHRRFCLLDEASSEKILPCLTRVLIE